MARLTEQQEILVGRDATCGLVIDHPAVSRKHARVMLRDDGRHAQKLGARLLRRRKSLEELLAVLTTSSAAICASATKLLFV